MLWYQCTILLEHSKNYRKTTDSLWNYYWDEPSDPLSSNSESSKYKTSISGNTYNLGAGQAGYNVDRVSKTKTEIVIPLKNLIKFWRTLNVPLINCEIELIQNVVQKLCFNWSGSKRCRIYNDPPAIVAPTGLEFKRADTKFYVPAVIFSTGNDNKLLEQLKSEFKRTIKWNKYRSL